MRWSKSSWGFFRWVSCSLFFISYRPFHSPCSCISRSPGSAERACGASPWQRWPPCWCPALPLGGPRCCPSTTTCWTSRQWGRKRSPTYLQYQNGEIQWKMRGRGNRFHSSGCGQIWWMAQGLIGDFPKLGRDTEKEEEEIMKYLEGCLGETRRRSTEPRLTLVSFKICSKLSLNTLDNHFIPFLTGQQSSQLRSMPKNCAFYTNDGNLR